MVDTARAITRNPAPISVPRVSNVPATSGVSSVPGVSGLRRVDEVRVIVGRGRPVAEVTGVAHRYPRTFRVSLATAAELAGAGVPLRIEHRGDNGRDEGR